jgi:hypothetical protein
MMEAGLKSYRSVFWDSVREMKEAPVGKIDLGAVWLAGFSSHEEEAD